jgi:Putative Zn-dependent protease, contains TPR repeats
MKNKFYFVLLLLSLLVFAPQLFSKPALAVNRIEGVVYDPDRVPVNDLRVELQDELGSLLQSSRTSAGGRFSFVGMSQGHFVIKIIPIGKNFLEETKDVEIVNVTRFSSDTAYVEIVLRYDKRSSEILPDRPAEAIFVQDVPQDAKKLYETGVNKLKKSQDGGLSDLEEAIKLFPNYFDALSGLGREYNSRKDYNKAYPYLIRAIDINPRSSNSYYGLAYAFLQLNQIPAAVEAARAVTILVPTYPEAQLLYGTLLRQSGNYKDAETALLKAKSLAKRPNPEVHWQLALLYNKLNRNKEAAAELETYLKMNPDSPDKKKIQDLIAKLKNTQKS